MPERRVCPHCGTDLEGQQINKIDGRPACPSCGRELDPEEFGKEEEWEEVWES